MIRKPLTNALLALALPLAFAASAAQADEVQSFDLEGLKKLEFYISKANVSLVGSDRTDLQLELEKPLAGFDPESVTQTEQRVGDTLVIKIEYETSEKGWFSWFSDNSKGYKAATLRVPAGFESHVSTRGGNVEATSMAAHLTLTTSGGNVSAENSTGPIKLVTSGGNIRLSNIAGDADARTSGGNINAENLSGAVELHTSGGNINVDGSVSSLEAHTSGGHVNARLLSKVTAPLVLTTSGGNVNAKLEKGISAPAKLTTSGGNVTLDLPPEQSFQIHAKANGGSAHLDHSGSFEGTLNQKKIDGDINGGGPAVTLSTNGGSVRVGEI